MTTNSETSGKAGRVDVLERILNCGEHMRDVHDVVTKLIESANDVLDGSKVIYVNFEDSGLYSVKKERLDAVQDALLRTRMQELEIASRGTK